MFAVFELILIGLLDSDSAEYRTARLFVAVVALPTVPLHTGPLAALSG